MRRGRGSRTRRDHRALLRGAAAGSRCGCRGSGRCSGGWWRSGCWRDRRRRRGGRCGRRGWCSRSRRHRCGRRRRCRYRCRRRRRAGSGGRSGWGSRSGCRCRRGLRQGGGRRGGQRRSRHRCLLRWSRRRTRSRCRCSTGLLGPWRFGTRLVSATGRLADRNGGLAGGRGSPRRARSRTGEPRIAGFADQRPRRRSLAGERWTAGHWRQRHRPRRQGATQQRRGRGIGGAVVAGRAELLQGLRIDLNAAADLVLRPGRA